MTANPALEPAATSPRPSRTWGWARLALGLVVVGLIRVPLVLNARAHLDSDLAVDGLALIDALNGHWRWHYPATPFIGSPPVLLSWVQARIWGPSPIALVSGGVVAYGLIVVGTYVLNRRAFGPSVAAWGLIPLVFASTGTVWLSGRVTGGHLLAAAWHAWVFVLFWDVMTRGGWRRSAALGLWCGLGLYVDTMFAVTVVGLGVAALVFLASVHGLVGSARRTVAIDPAAHETVRTADPTNRGGTGGVARAFVCVLAFALAAGLGVAPRLVGQWADPHDAYVGQFEPVGRGDLVARNAGILALDCLPRFIGGHRLPWLQAEPDPSALRGGTRVSPEKSIPWVGILVTVVSLGLFAGAMVVLVMGERKAAGGATPPRPNPSPKGGKEPESPSARWACAPARLAIRWGLIASSLAVLAGFLVHPTITNSDNYRYLVDLLVPWSMGFGLLMARVASKRLGMARVVAVGFAALMLVDSDRWYARFGWVDANSLPTQKAVDDPALAWLDTHPEVSAIFGSYWDVYRLSFLTGGRVKGVPFGEYPRRFPENAANLPPSRQRALIVRPDGVGPRYLDQAIARGTRELGRGPGLLIVEWPEGMRP